MCLKGGNTMDKINYKIYTMAMIELLVNGNNQTDLGTHTLEYFVDFAEVGAGDMYEGDACLAVATRLKNKSTQSIEWGNIYYKRLIQNSDAISKESRLKLENRLNQIFESSLDEKINFIFRAERKFLKTPYLKSEFIEPQLAAFLKKLGGSSSFDDYPTVSLDRKFPTEVVPNIELLFNDVVTKNQKLSSENQNIKR